MHKITIQDTLSRNIEDLPGEIWEDVPGFEGRYQVSIYSRVKSIIFRNHVIIKKDFSGGKYRITLYSKYGRIKHFHCGRLCLSVFGREPKENEVIRYKDNNSRFDVLDNLVWVSPSERFQELFKQGKFPKNHGLADRNGMSKLSLQQREEIRAKKGNGISSAVLAKQYGVSETTIRNIKVIAKN